MATIDLGKIKQVWRGTYNNGTAYVVDDLVAYTDSNITSTYICVANSTGNAPSSSGTAHASWNYVAKGVVDPIPSQSGNSGKALITNGSAVSWGDGGAWTKIASGSGPSSSVTSISIDNLFSDSYKFYKVFYSWSQDDWMKARYINADGSVNSSATYGWAGQYASDNGDEHGRFGNVNQTFMALHYWEGADDSPAIVEMTLYHPYASSMETNNIWTGMNIQGTKIFTMQGCNSDYATGSRRGLHFFGNSGDTISTNFNYLVLGSNIG